MIGQLYCHVTLLSRSVTIATLCESQRGPDELLSCNPSHSNRDWTVRFQGFIYLEMLFYWIKFFFGKTNEKYNKNIYLKKYIYFFNVFKYYFWNILGPHRGPRGPWRLATGGVKCKVWFVYKWLPVCCVLFLVFVFSVPMIEQPK